MLNNNVKFKRVYWASQKPVAKFVNIFLVMDENRCWQQNIILPQLLPVATNTGTITNLRSYNIQYELVKSILNGNYKDVEEDIITNVLNIGPHFLVKFQNFHVYSPSIQKQTRYRKLDCANKNQRNFTFRVDLRLPTKACFSFTAFSCVYVYVQWTFAVNFDFI